MKWECLDHPVERFVGISPVVIPSALTLIVRANVEIHDAPIQQECVDFTGTLEQIADDIKRLEENLWQRIF
jgi:hypothetical protein